MQTICLNHSIEEVKSSIGVCTFNHCMRLLCAIERASGKTNKTGGSRREQKSGRDFTEKIDR